MGLRRLKVYGWTAIIAETLRERLGVQPWIRQGRAFVAAESMAAVGRIVGRRYQSLFNLGETGIEWETREAMAHPREVLVCPLDGPRVCWVKAEPGEVS